LDSEELNMKAMTEAEKTIAMTTNVPDYFGQYNPKSVVVGIAHPILALSHL